MPVPVPTAYDGRTEEERSVAESQQMNTARSPTAAETSAAHAKSLSDGSSYSWNGFRYVFGKPDLAQKLTNDLNSGGPNIERPTRPGAGAAAAPPVFLSDQLAKYAPQVAPASGSGFVNLGAPRQSVTSNRPATFDPRFSPDTQLTNPNAPTPAAPPTADDVVAPEIDSGKIDDLLGSLDSVRSQIEAIGQNGADFQQSKGELLRQLDLAKQHAIGNARGGPRRGVSALVSQGMGEQAALTADATQNMAVLNAQQEDQKRNLELDVQNTLGDLGLNQAGLDIKVGAENVGAVTNSLNQLFIDHGLNLQLDESEAARVTKAVQDWLFISTQLDGVDQATQDATLDRILKVEGIDARTALAIKQMKANEPTFLERTASAIKAVAPIAALAIASDERLKTDITDAGENDLAELLSTFRPKTYTYNDQRFGEGTQFGGMAQDLERTKLGAGMVQKTDHGIRTVHGGKAGMAALAGVSMLYRKLQALEESL